MIDTLITGGHLLTMAGDGVGFVEGGAVAIDGGKIVAVGPRAEVEAKAGNAKETIDATDRLVMPGLVDAHTHSSATLMRGWAQEVATWKRVIRVIAHELNNSLAPISSLAHSGQLLAHAPPDAGQLVRVFATIEDRARHLAGFIEGYAQFAKLPRPRLAAVAWEVLIERLRVVVSFELRGPLPRREGAFDTGQISFAFWAAARKASSEAPGIFARTVRRTSVMVKPPPSAEPVTAEEALISSAVRFSWPRTPESCIE